MQCVCEVMTINGLGGSMEFLIEFEIECVSKKSTNLPRQPASVCGGGGGGGNLLARSV